jgi:hypothetical protein
MPGPSEEVRRDRKAADINADIGQAKRERFLQAVKDGMRLSDARIAADMKTDQAYRYHRKKFPRWASQVDFFLNAAKAFDRAGLDNISTPTTFADFVTKWFPDRDPHLPHQLMIADALNSLGPREICLFLLWPSAGKTSTLEDYICRKLAFDPSHRFRYVSEGTNLSKRVVGTVQRRFTETSEYGPFIARYGPFYEKGQERNGRPWTTEEITIASNPGTERDRNLVATSWTAASYGSRVDTLVLDDIQSQRNMNQSEDIFDRIRGTFFSRDSRKSELRTLIVGTRIGTGDFYERMMDAGLITKLIVLPVTDENGDPTAPDFWDREVYHDGGACCMGFRTCPRDHTKLTPREFVELMRHQAGEKAWHASYLQNPESDERSTFAAYLDKCLDRDRSYGPLVVA